MNDEINARSEDEFELSLDGINKIPSEQKIEVFSKYMDDMFGLLSEKSSNVIVVGSLPPAIINFKGKLGIPSVVEILSEQYFTHVETFNTLLEKKTAKFDFAYIDIANELCSLKFCKVRDDGMFFYSDDVHLSDYGQSTIMMPLIRQELNNLKTK